MNNPNLTQSGVCYNLYKSPYHFEYGGFVWYFSSIPHMLKFENKAKIKTDWLTDSFTNRFKYVVDASILALFQLYNQVETRGFYIINKETCQEYHSLSDVPMKVVLNV